VRPAIHLISVQSEKRRQTYSSTLQHEAQSPVLITRSIVTESPSRLRHHISHPRHRNAAPKFNTHHPRYLLLYLRCHITSSSRRRKRSRHRDRSDTIPSCHQCAISFHSQWRYFCYQYSLHPDICQHGVRRLALGCYTSCRSDRLGRYSGDNRTC
jgi:hypothetical protein